jgi:hypothetical protein
MAGLLDCGNWPRSGGRLPIRITYNYLNIPVIVVRYQWFAVQPAELYYGTFSVFLVCAGGGCVIDFDVRVSLTDKRDIMC